MLAGDPSVKLGAKTKKKAAASSSKKTADGDGMTVEEVLCAPRYLISVCRSTKRRRSWNTFFYARIHISAALSE